MESNLQDKWGDAPVAEGIITLANIDQETGMVDISIKPSKIDGPTNNLMQTPGRSKLRPFRFIGRAAILFEHRYEDPADMIGKRAIMFSSDNGDSLAVEPQDPSQDWRVVLWVLYT